MIKPLLLALSFALIVGFGTVKLLAQDHQIATDGYWFGKPTVPTRHLFKVSIHEEGDETQMMTDYLKAYPHNGVTPGYELRGFYVFDKDTNTCHIYMYDPNIAYWPETYGHELMHCIYGNFHDEQSRERLKEVLNGSG